MFENSRRGRQARNVTTNARTILDLKSPSEQIFSRKFRLGAPELITCFKLFFYLKPKNRLLWQAKTKYIFLIFVIYRTERWFQKIFRFMSTLCKKLYYETIVEYCASAFNRNRNCNVFFFFHPSSATARHSL